MLLVWSGGLVEVGFKTLLICLPPSLTCVHPQLARPRHQLEHIYHSRRTSSYTQNALIVRRPALSAYCEKVTVSSPQRQATCDERASPHRRRHQRRGHEHDRDREFIYQPNLSRDRLPSSRSSSEAWVSITPSGGRRQTGEGVFEPLGGGHIGVHSLSTPSRCS